MFILGLAIVIPFLFQQEEQLRDGGAGGVAAVALFLMVGMVSAVATYHCTRIFNLCSPCQRAALGATVRRG